MSSIKIKSLTELGVDNSGASLFMYFNINDGINLDLSSYGQKAEKILNVYIGKINFFQIKLQYIVADALLIQYSLFGSNRSSSLIGWFLIQYSELLHVFTKYSNQISLHTFKRLIVHNTFVVNRLLTHFQSLHI